MFTCFQIEQQRPWRIPKPVIQQLSLPHLKLDLLGIDLISDRIDMRFTLFFPQPVKIDILRLNERILSINQQRSLS